MKIVKARIKKLEDFDPKFLCCETKSNLIKELNKKEEVFEVDLDNITEVYSLCEFCGHVSELVRACKITDEIRKHNGRRVTREVFDYMDIDEGL